MRTSPFISVIIPLYNKERTIEATIQSVLNQSFNDFELLIVDDGSEDGSIELISAINDQRLIILRKTNGGVSSARNYGVEYSNSDYIFFLDADDIITRDCLAVFADLVCRFKEAAFYTSNFKILNNNQEYSYCHGNKEGFVVNPLKSLWQKKIFPRTGSMLIKRECFEKVGCFREDISVYEDLEFILRIIKVFKVAYSPKTLLIYQIEFNSMSLARVPLFKEFSYHISLKTASFFEKLILAENIYYSFKSRVKIGDKIGKLELLRKFRGNFIFICYSILSRKIISLWYKLKKN